MNVGQRQDVSSLRFYLYDRPVHPEFFDIYHDHLVVKSAYEAQIWVTGCTHVIGCFKDGFSLVEITAAAPTLLPKRGRLVEMPFRGERDHQHRRAEGVNYMMSFQVETMSPMVYKKTHHELACLGAKKGMFVPFPMWMNPESPGLTPFTYIDYDARAGELHVFTFHAFPENLTMVRTQSIFEMK